METLAIRFRRFRVAAGLTQDELAQAIGRKQASVQRIEAGKTTKSKDLHEYAAVMGVSYAQLVEGKEDNKSDNEGIQQAAEVKLSSEALLRELSKRVKGSISSQQFIEMLGNFLVIYNERMQPQDILKFWEAEYKRVTGVSLKQTDNLSALCN